MAVHDPRPLEPNPEENAEGADPASLSTFGRYLLFKRLGKDALGEVYRAGQLGDDAIERVVSLRLFNATEIDGDGFRAHCAGRDGIDSILRGGPYGEVVDAGCESGVAYVAYEFVCGRSLAQLIAQARERTYPVALDQTLHLLDRIAVALQNAYETRIEGERITHGFLVPDFVHLSSEGEVRLVGFESSGGLLELSPSSPTRARLAGYISPEVNAGQPPGASDDVYSLGSILAELLTGEPLPALNPAESSRWVEAATLVEDGAPIPDAIRLLLRDSLLPRDQRIQSAGHWHKALIEAATAHGHSATTFDVAFFMHTLFGAELENEAEVVRAELEAEIPPPELTSALPAIEPETETAAPSPTRAAEESPEPLADLDDLDDEEPAVASPPPVMLTEARAQSAVEERSNRRWIWIAAAALLAAGGAAAYFFLGPPSADAPAPIQVAVAPRVDTVVAPPPVADTVVSGISEMAPPLSPEELESQVRSLVAQRAGDLEANLKAEYDQRLVELRRQLEDARQATSVPAEPEATAAPEPEPAAEAPEASVDAEQGPAQRDPVQAAVEPQQPVTPPQAIPVAEPRAEAVRTPLSAPVERAVELPTAAKPVEPTPAEPVAAKPAPVEPGSIVTTGPGVKAPTLVKQPSVVYPPVAARMKRQATVKLRVLIDEKGRPTEVQAITKKVGLGFDGAAERAARTTRWTPPTKDGVPVKMWVELSIDFRP